MNNNSFVNNLLVNEKTSTSLYIYKNIANLIHFVTLHIYKIFIPSDVEVAPRNAGTTEIPERGPVWALSFFCKQHMNIQFVQAFLIWPFFIYGFSKFF